MSRRFLAIGSLAGVGAAGYYFYQAGGDASKASEYMRNDVNSLSQKAKEEEKPAERLGAKIDKQLENAKEQSKSIGSSIQSYGDDATKRLDDTRKSTGSELMKGVDKFDKAVEDSASKAKGGISSWFGFK